MGAGFPPSCMRFIAAAKTWWTCCSPPAGNSPPPPAAANVSQNSYTAIPTVARSWSADGFTALHFAAFFGQEAIAILLLQHSADASAEARNPMKVTPLHSAAAAHNLPIVRALLQHGAPANARQQQGWTTLHEAAQNGDEAMVQLLLKHGADANAANDDGMTPAQLASKKGHTEIAKLLA
jgi:hypothetical protein